MKNLTILILILLLVSCDDPSKYTGGGGTYGTPSENTSISATQNVGAFDITLEDKISIVKNQAFKYYTVNKKTETSDTYMELSKDSILVFRNHGSIPMKAVFGLKGDWVELKPIAMAYITLMGEFTQTITGTAHVIKLKLDRQTLGVLSVDIGPQTYSVEPPIPIKTNPLLKGESSIKKHFLREGETIKSVANRYGMSEYSIMNHPDNKHLKGRESSLPIGTEIIIPPN